MLSHRKTELLLRLIILNTKYTINKIPEIQMLLLVNTNKTQKQ